jgi:hypothetical protein
VKIDRKQAIRDYKLRKAARGIFAVRCAAAQKVWVGSSLDLDKAQNREWFILRNGAHTNAALQREWNSHGEQAFEYAVLEKLDDDVSAIRVNDVLGEKKRRWIVQLDAEPVQIADAAAGKPPPA